MKKINLLIGLIAPITLVAQLTPQFVQVRPAVAVFNYTGAIQSWVVPAGITAIYFDVQAAQGGSKSATALGGLGGRVTGKMTVTPGMTLYITVGGQPLASSPLYTGGGSGGTNLNATATAVTSGMAGGGLSAIASGSTLTQGNAYVIAGGGGGSSRMYSGGNGGGTTGADGIGTWFSYLSYGRGATPTAGGTIGTSVDPQAALPTPGSVLTGGNGGLINTSLTTWTGGGGGGGGYYGGGGGCGGGSANGGGGGGSSYTTVTGISNAAHTQGFKTGNGAVYIFY